MKNFRLVTFALLAVVSAGSLIMFGLSLTHRFAQAGEPVASGSASGSSSASGGLAGVSEPPIHWYAGLKIAHEESLRTGRPLLIVFKADWCSHCQKLDRETLSDGRIAHDVNESFVPLELDLEEDAEIAQTLEVERIPCMIALNPQSDLLGRIVGFVDAGQLRDALVKVRALHTRVARKYAAAEATVVSTPTGSGATTLSK